MKIFEITLVVLAMASISATWAGEDVNPIDYRKLCNESVTARYALDLKGSVYVDVACSGIKNQTQLNAVKVSLRYDFKNLHFEFGDHSCWHIK